MSKKKTIVIVGGGFAGVNFIKKLANNNSYQVILVDKNNYNFFPPLIYQVATGFLENSNISYPFRKYIKGKNNLSFRMGTLLKVIPTENKIILSNGELNYDYLVFATGTETNYFGIENIKNNALPMKTLDDALLMRNCLLERLERATFTTDIEEKKRLITIVIAGGGPTGVEISGILAELKKTIIKKEYPELIGAGGDIYLVNGAAELLSPMSTVAQKYTLESLQKLGVKVLLKTRVNDFNKGKVYLGNGDIIEAETLLWASGVKSISFEGIPEEVYGPGNRMQVDGFNKLNGFDNIYALGDTCLMVSDEKYPNGHPQLAQVAIQQATNLATNFKNIALSKPLKTFKYLDKGSMAIIGRNKAVADLPFRNTNFTGFFAWFMWLFVHLLSLINFRNKAKTLYDWTMAYLTGDNCLRMIIRPVRKDKDNNL